MRIAFCGAGVLALSCSVAFAQTPTTTDRLDQLERRLTQTESDLKARNAEIARLREQVGQTPPTTHPAGDAVEQSRQDALKDIDSKSSAPLTLRTPVSFNPDLAVVTNFVGSASSRGSNPARNRFDVGSVELDLRAAVAPIADGVAVLPVAHEVENPLFFNSADAEGGAETGIEIEEAYIFLHDFGVPNLTAKLGKYHLRFGRQNVLHEHDWPTVDNNFVNQSFLGEEALSDAGLSLSYVIPPRMIGGQYVELIGELISGEGGGETTPVVNNTALVDSPAINTHALWDTDVASAWNMELGTSFLASKHNDDSQQNARLYGADFTLIHTDPTGGFNNQLFQAEAIYGDVDTSRTDTQHAFGAYLLAQQQLSRDWYVGCRLDWTENAVDDKQEVWAVSPYVTWYYFEFLRFRLEYQHKDGDIASEENLFFQATWIFGAHPPHPYWTMR